MIVKERDLREHPEQDRFAVAGAKAEAQLAFYLRRAFVDDPTVLVFNDLRFKDDTGDSAQIDHLILHPYGFIVIESKSVSSGIKVNRQGEWIRFWDRQPQGMPSPVQQAKRQIEFLRRALNANAGELRDKLLGVFQGGFLNRPMEIIVAISDQATITRDGFEVPEVCKADQVPDRIREILARHKRAAHPLNLKATLDLSNHDGLAFSKAEIARITQFLLQHHYPLAPEKTEHPKPATNVTKNVAPPQAIPPIIEPKPAPVPAPPPAKGLGICTKCHSQCTIVWGKFGYHWKCLRCDSNLPLKEYCPTCRGKMKLRKDGRRYFKYCDTCASGETLYCEFVTP